MPRASSNVFGYSAVRISALGNRTLAKVREWPSHMLFLFHGNQYLRKCFGLGLVEPMLTVMGIRGGIEELASAALALRRMDRQTPSLSPQGDSQRNTVRPERLPMYLCSTREK